MDSGKDSRMDLGGDSRDDSPVKDSGGDSGLDFGIDSKWILLWRILE